ncbi:hypothetical protein OB2597_06320 [Pseudooceanicola batsensis HTCC2597]|uniref:SPOR domain-containing protein n=1 Tax=Pseudooceanicola batsensis (strain ATCC BAA-863 / DSM 15984 / KCTC 12145 / HTCC2597) TaxID=252305 RepID=A3TT99_PSEBH|nr:SPOR domain-containing protein [Pseudooceanicola batsensis]EAQ04876.1 hypothetical protein OB2597_06320 [Pseudooceanicola batsensis HTCC2597]
MNRFSRRLSLLLLTVLAGGGTALAQGSRGPAEYPPASFKGTQYVDSAGCVFVRAGIDGNVVWVPRMSRNRRPVCGFQPTPVAGATSAPAASSAAEVTVITAARPETAAPAPPRAAVRRPEARPSSAAAPVAAPSRSSRPAPVVTGPSVAPVTIARTRRVPAAPAVEARPRAVAPGRAPHAATRVTGVCPGLSVTGQRYMGYGGQAGLRCGPQAGYAPGHLPRPAGAAPRVAVPGQAVPLAASSSVPAYDARVPEAPGAKVFEVPRQKVKRVTRARTTTQAQISPRARVVPDQVYRNRLLSQEGIALPEGYKRVWEDDRLNPRRAEQTLAGKRRMEMVWTQTVPRRLVPVEIAPRDRATTARVSSRSAKPAAPRGAQYIQVGTFRTPSNAQAVARRLAASGLPVRLRHSGTAQVVLAGPFGNDRDLGRALSTARRAGFSDAFPRR